MRCSSKRYDAIQDGAMFDEVDQDVDRPIDSGEEVGSVSDVLYPQWPVNFLLLQSESTNQNSRLDPKICIKTLHCSSWEFHQRPEVLKWFITAREDKLY